MQGLQGRLPQIARGSGCWAMHPAEVLALATESRGHLPERVPERRYLDPPARAGAREAALTLGAVAATALLVWLGLHGRVQS
jgi:hypothetical protein